MIADQAAELFDRLHSAMSDNMRELLRMGCLGLLIWADRNEVEVTLWELYRLPAVPRIDGRGQVKKGESKMSTQEKLILITNVQLHDLGNDGPTRAIGSVTIGGAFVVQGVRVVEGEKGPFVAMPQRKEGDRYRDVAHPVTSEMRALVSHAVLEEYERLKSREQQERGRTAR